MIWLTVGSAIMFIVVETWLIYSVLKSVDKDKK